MYGGVRFGQTANGRSYDPLFRAHDDTETYRQATFLEGEALSIASFFIPVAGRPLDARNILRCFPLLQAVRLMDPIRNGSYFSAMITG